MQTLELSISGMTCGACVNHVTKGLQGVPGVQNVRVDLASARASVSGDSLDVAQLTAAVEEEGYGATPASVTGQSPGQSTNDTKAGVIPLSAQGCSCCD